MSLSKSVNVVFMGLLLFVMSGCGSTPSATAESNAGVGMDIDVAIKEAALQMETKLPAQTKVALVSVASPSTAFSEQVLTRLESAIVGSGKLVVVDRANLDKIRAEQGFQLSGEVDDDSAKSIGKLLGAGAIVTGSLTDLGDVYALTLKAINIETATVATSYLADLAKSERIKTLFASGGGVASGGGTAVVTARSENTATPAAPAVTATSAIPQSAPAPAVPRVTYKVGDTGPAGGIIFYDKRVFSNGWRYLEAIPVEMELSAQWGTDNQDVGGTSTTLGTGKRNTELIVEALRQLRQGDRAADLCAAFEFGGYDDWFLPSKDELDLMYKNLKQAGLGGFSGNNYWSSSQKGDGRIAWTQSFSNGNQDNWRFEGKDNTYSVRAVRAF
jgi:hypothetical protein